MITAELEHRDYVPHRTIAIYFSSLEFHGDYRTIKPLNEISDLIKHMKQTTNEVRIECVENKIADNEEKIKKLSTELKDLRKRLIAAMLVKNCRKRIKELRAKIDELNTMNYNLNALIDEIDERDNCYDDFYGSLKTSSITGSYRSILAELGFTPTSSHHSDNTDIEHEFYTYNGDEEELLKLAEAKLAEMQKDLENRCKNIKINYSRKLMKNEIPYADGIGDETIVF